MGFLAKLRAWWRRRFGSGDADAPSDHECAVCGTAVDEPDGTCSLCRSTDIVAAGARNDERGDGSAAKTTASRHVAASDDASVGRLRELREDGELLERYADRWRAVDGGYRVETSGGTRVVDSREEVVALLRAEAG